MSILPVVLATNALDTFVHTFIKAMALGSLYSLLALGFVLIYKATQTVNFAQGALALAGTWLVSIIFMDWEVPGRWIGGPGWFHWVIALLLAAVRASARRARVATRSAPSSRESTRSPHRERTSRFWACRPRARQWPE